MPLHPKVRPIGQEVVTVGPIKSYKGSIPIGSYATIESINIDRSSSKVQYKICCHGIYVWVKAADIKTPK